MPETVRFDAVVPQNSSRSAGAPSNGSIIPKGQVPQPLPTKFRGRADQRGFEFTLLRREGDVALLEKRGVANGSASWEVVIIQKELRTRYFPNGDIQLPHEYLPASELWGTYGWSLCSLERAWAKFQEVLDARPLKARGACGK